MSKEPKGFISWANAGPRKVVGGCPVAPDRVRVYYNLQKDCLSVIDTETGRLYCHAHRVEIHNAKFRVQLAGRNRVIKEKRKNVHAYVVGNLHNVGDVQPYRFIKSRNILYKKRICDCGDKPYDYCEKCIPESGKKFRHAYYSPYKHDTFVDEMTKESLFRSKRVVLRDKTAVGPHFNIFYIPEPKKK